MHLKSEASIQIQKPCKEVFEGIVNPVHMTQYFISESSDRLDAGKELKWKFPEFDEVFPIYNIEIVDNKSISFRWDPETTVDILLIAQANNSTVVKVTEGDKQLNAKNLKWLISNAAGWANFLACMKAYLEYGIPLRKGAYDFMRKSDF